MKKAVAYHLIAFILKDLFYKQTADKLLEEIIEDDVIFKK